MGRKKGGKNKEIRLDHDHIAHDSKKTINNPSVEQNNKINKEQQNILKRVVNDLTKTFGHDAFHYAKDEKVKEKISFPISEMNKLTGGGIQLGSFSVIWGGKSNGKTTLTYYLIAQAQKQNKRCALFDLENSFDSIWAEKCGVNLDTLLLGHFKTAEQAMDSLIKLCKEKVMDFIVLDSIQSLSPTGEQETKKGKEKSIEDDTMALLARKLSQFFRVSASSVYKGKVGILLIGQSRIDLGGFVKLETLSGGNALQHWSSLTIKIRRGQKVDAPRYKFKDNKGKKKEIIIGFSLVMKIQKTKVSGTAPENTEIRLPFYYEYGFKRPTDKQVEKMYSNWIEFENDVEE